jgi:hypothetical protein
MTTGSLGGGGSGVKDQQGSIFFPKTSCFPDLSRGGKENAQKKEQEIDFFLPPREKSS